MCAADSTELQGVQGLLRYPRDTNGLSASAVVTEIDRRLAEIRGWLGRPEPAARAEALALAANAVTWLRSIGGRDLAQTGILAESVSAVWLAYGQACEGLGGQAYLEEALRAYAEAIAVCGGRVDAERLRAPVRSARALAWMNRGNALQARGSAADLDAAVWAYDEAIAAFERLFADSANAAESTGNSLGAAWLNRGRALQAQATPASLRLAVASFGRAVAVLDGMPAGPNPWPRINLAAARMNLANASLALAGITVTDVARREVVGAALAAARAACAGIAPLEEAVGAAAEVALMSRRVQACALGECLAWSDTSIPAVQRRAWTSEVSDAVEGGLACVLTWEARGVSGFRPLAARLFRLGLQLYRVHQPQFLAEFVLELLDPAEAETASLPLTAQVELLAEAQAAIAAAQSELRTQHRIDLDSEKTARLLQTLAALEAADRRLDELRLRS